MNVRNNCPIIGLNREVNENFSGTRAISQASTQSIQTLQTQYQSCTSKEDMLKDMFFQRSSGASAEYPPMFCSGTSRPNQGGEDYGVRLGGRPAVDPYGPFPKILNGQCNSSSQPSTGRPAVDPFNPFHKPGSISTSELKGRPQVDPYGPFPKLVNSNSTTELLTGRPAVDPVNPFPKPGSISTSELKGRPQVDPFGPFPKVTNGSCGDRGNLRVPGVQPWDPSQTRIDGKAVVNGDSENFSVVGANGQVIYSQGQGGSVIRVDSVEHLTIKGPDGRTVYDAP